MDLINGAVPPEQLEACLELVRSDPPHPGSIVRDLCLGGSMTSKTAAQLLDVEVEGLERVLDGRDSITPGLALRMEAAGWSQAALWLDLQTDHDLAQARRQLAA